MLVFITSINHTASLRLMGSCSFCRCSITDGVKMNLKFRVVLTEPETFILHRLRRKPSEVHPLGIMNFRLFTTANNDFQSHKTHYVIITG